MLLTMAIPNLPKRWSLFVMLIMLFLSRVSVFVDADHESQKICERICRHADQSLLLIGLYMDRLIIITSDRRITEMPIDDENKQNVQLNIGDQHFEGLERKYSVLALDRRFNDLITGNYVSAAFIIMWRERIRMVFASDSPSHSSVEYYIPWDQVYTNKFRLPKVANEKVIPLSNNPSADGRNSFEFFAIRRRTPNDEIRIQAIRLDKKELQCDIFDMKQIFQNPKNNYLCYDDSSKDGATGSNIEIYIEGQPERRCNSVVKIPVLNGFLTRNKVYLIAPSRVYYFSRSALTSYGTRHTLHNVSLDQFFKCESTSKAPRKYENVLLPEYEEKSFFSKNKYIFVGVGSVAAILLALVGYCLLRKRPKRRRRREDGTSVGPSYISSKDSTTNDGFIGRFNAFSRMGRKFISQSLKRVRPHSPPLFSMKLSPGKVRPTGGKRNRQRTSFTKSSMTSTTPTSSPASSGASSEGGFRKQMPKSITKSGIGRNRRSPKSMGQVLRRKTRGEKSKGIARQAKTLGSSAASGASGTSDY